MPTNELLPFATGGGANVMSQSDYAAMAARLVGFSAGTALSPQLNKAWRQAAFAAAMIGEFTADYGGADVLDDGDVATFEANFDAAIQARALLAGLITTAVVKTVHGTSPDFADLRAAFAWLSNYRISSTGSVTFNLRGAASGSATQYSYGSTGLAIVHPDLGRVFINGAAMLGAAPANADFTITGSGSGARATDRASHLTVLRSRFATELNFTGGASITVIGSLGGIGNLLITGDRTTGAAPNQGNLLQFAAGSATVTGPLAVHGAGSNGIYFRSCVVATGAVIMAAGCVGQGIRADSARIDLGANAISLSNDADGFLPSTGGSLANAIPGVTAFARGNGGHGMHPMSGGSMSLSSGGVASSNAQSGVYSEDASFNAPSLTAQSNGINGVTTLRGTASVPNLAASSNTNYGIYNDGGRVTADTISALNSNGVGSAFATDGGINNLRSATGLTGLSPAANTVGNSNALNIV